MADDIIIIKKYANRRLYNTETSTYITLEELAQLIREGRNFEVVDAKTGADLTRAVLAQILFEEESKGASMLPVQFLRNLISFYDNSMQTVLPHYLEMVMDTFIKNQQHIKEKTEELMGGFSPFNPVQNMQEMQRRNLEQLQHVMGVFNPFLRPEEATNDKDKTIAELSARVANLTAELERLKSTK
jgi:polyhydroxyalkanoate synthesis repressor PhaR